MGKLRRPLVLVSAALALGSHAAASGQEPEARPRVPLLFAANQGQCASEVRFQARAPGMVASVLAGGLHLDLGGAALTLRFRGSAALARVDGVDPRGARAHFLSAERAVRDVATCARVRITGLYPGIDLELYERDGRVEYDLCLAPLADPAVIALAMEGADATAIDADGALVATVGGRTFRQLAPVAWQVGADGVQRPVACRWTALGGGLHGFETGARAPDAALVIDPVLVYGAYVGGSSADEARAVHLDEQGCVYVTGWARSADFPGAEGAPRGKDAVVFKLAPGGRELVHATYLGGRGDDDGVALHVDASGEIVVGGNNESADFPTTANAFARAARGGLDAFVVKLSADGSRVVFATLLGGSAEDTLAALAPTASGQITVAGTTRSRDFPVSSGSYGEEPRGARDVFVTRLDPSGERVAFSTRFGGSEDDEASGLAVDSEGCSYVVGRTGSHDFPATLGAFDDQRCGLDGFALKLSAGGRTLLYSTFLGGSGKDEATAVAVDADRRAVVVGWTQSLDFPFDPDRKAPGRKDGFAVRLTETGNGLQYAIPLGGGSADEALGVALDPLGSAWVVGRSRSSDFPVTGDAHQARLAGPADAFLVQLAPEEGGALYATFLGGAGEDELRGIAFDRSGTALALGGVSSGIAQDQRGALSGRRRGPSDAFVLCVNPRGTKPVTPASSMPTAAGIGF